MTTNGQRRRNINGGLLAVWILLIGGCGGATATPSYGGESHFLRTCSAECGSGFDCISGVCTQGCVVGEDSCGKLDANATCTADSIEPGAVAVCDVACTSTEDCADLGSTHTCENGYCRGTPVTPDPGGSTGGAGNGSQSEALLGEYLFDSSEGYEPVAGTTLRITFGEDTVSFNAGCNAHSGTYSLDGDTLVVGGMGSTQMGCDAELHTQDQWLAAFLESDPTVTIDADTVTLANDEATLRLLDREIADPNRPLTGVTWEIDSLITGDAVSSVPAVTPTVIFNADSNSTLTVFAGCNTGEGTYEYSDTEVTIGMIGFTETGCLDRAIMEVEAHVQQVFAPGTSTYTIEANRLTLERDGVGIMATTQ